MNIPSNVYKQFAKKVYSCKADTLKREQSLRKRKFIENLKKQRDEFIEGETISRAYLRDKQIEKISYSVLNYLIVPKRFKARNFEVVMREAFQI